MDVLVVGGTRFVGRHIVEAALERDVAITMSNRGNHAQVFPDVPLIRGDRNAPGDLARAGRAGTLNAVGPAGRDTLAWLRTARGDRPWQAGLDRDRESGLIAAWRSRS